MKSDWSKPDLLYRVNCSCCSQAPTVEGQDIVARSSANVNLFAQHDERKLEELKKCFEQHMDWSCREPSPFMSAYGDEEKARERAEQRVDDEHLDVTVTTIDASLLGKGAVRHVLSVRAQFNIQLEEKVYYAAQHEFLILHRVPKEAILDVELVDS
ncbi:hypothetical protein Purlil1_7145 [Purpureocillium lilacinum]|uniref:DUF7587 domain-containing protein n=1 Tax=Purpureocillium lilacinum TaxID=33203 RepID=A0ABR0BX27_PURLI|nr:hypothetical protein Purlil1_7145 [Purpureocillium lilacinum]GJN73960.1 hypothetical protein PLICBS_008044 [Purpureocillium lilacinum]